VVRQQVRSRPGHERGESLEEGQRLEDDRAGAPNKVVLVRPEGEQGEVISEIAPFAALQVAKDGKPTLYLCRDFACELPTHDVGHVVEQLASRLKR
jgi:uncharacterized protein YyaL (SSP411 family)